MTLFRTDNLIAQYRCEARKTSLIGRLENQSGDFSTTIENCNSEKCLRDREIVEDIEMKSFCVLYHKLQIEKNPRYKLKVLLPAMERAINTRPGSANHREIIKDERLLIVEEILNKLSKTKNQVEGERLSRILDGERLVGTQALVLFNHRMRLRI